MSMCTVCNHRSNFAVKLPNYAIDKKLAFVESVCATLLESRFGPAFIAERWLEPQPAPFSGGLARRLRRHASNTGKPAAELRRDECLTTDEPLYNHQSRFARPAALAKNCSLPATKYSIEGIREILAMFLASVPSRGSPIFSFLRSFIGGLARHPPHAGKPAA
jgi:hypothetical protein